MTKDFMVHFKSIFRYGSGKPIKRSKVITLSSDINDIERAIENALMESHRNIIISSIEQIG